MPRSRVLVAVSLALLVPLAACSGGDDDAGATTTTETVTVVADHLNNPRQIDDGLVQAQELEAGQAGLVLAGVAGVALAQTSNPPPISMPIL